MPKPEYKLQYAHKPYEQLCQRPLINQVKLIPEKSLDIWLK